MIEVLTHWLAVTFSVFMLAVILISWAVDEIRWASGDDDDGSSDRWMRP